MKNKFIGPTVLIASLTILSKLIYLKNSNKKHHIFVIWPHRCHVLKSYQNIGSKYLLKNFNLSNLNEISHVFYLYFNTYNWEIWSPHLYVKPPALQWKLGSLLLLLFLFLFYFIFSNLWDLWLSVFDRW